MTASLISARRALGTLRRAAQVAFFVARGRSLVTRRADAPAVALLPTAVREGASLLRIYEMAGPLERLGWQVMLLPPRFTLEDRRRVLDAFRPHVVLMQTARNPLNRPRLYPGHKVLIDMDDADFHFDWLADKVTQDVGDADGVVAGSAYIADWCRHAGAVRADVVWTGTPPSERARTDPADRPPIVAWAQGYPCSYDREAEMVIRAMTHVIAARPDACLRLYDRGREDAKAEARLEDRIRAAGIPLEWLPAMPYADYLASFDDVAVGLAPLSTESCFSRGKSFGKILAYLDRRVPVVASEVSEPARFFTPATGIFAEGEQDWSAAILQLLDDGGLRRRLTGAAFEAFSARLTTQASGAQLSGILRDVAGLAPGLTVEQGGGGT